MGGGRRMVDGWWMGDGLHDGCMGWVGGWMDGIDGMDGWDGWMNVMDGRIDGTD